MIDLYSHNKEAYEKVMGAIAEGKKRIAIVHATGTGKTYVLAAVSEHYKKVMVIAPNNFVLDESRKVCGDNVEFKTYSSLIHETHFTSGYDLIVIDEFHRSGAEKWAKGVQSLLEVNPNAIVIGTSATHIRYLDNERNMADELFDGNIVSRLPLKEAIDRGILPNPTYVSALYEVETEISKYKKTINRSKKREEINEKYLRKLDHIANNWSNSHGVPHIIRKYFDKDMKRIIVFCSKVSKAVKARTIIKEWLLEAGYKRIRFYNIDYTEKDLYNEMADFQEDVEDDTLKVAISVNMLNEGVHIPRIDGIIMLRTTISRIIIEQQIGRCLTANNLVRKPVILDLVNNMDLIDNLIKPAFSEWKHLDNDDDDEKAREGFPFKVIDECRDVRIFFEQINNEYENKLPCMTINEVLEKAEEYYKEHGNVIGFPYMLYLTNHRKQIMEYPAIVERLKELGFRRFVDTDKENYKQLLEMHKRGEKPNVRTSLYNWAIRQLDKKGEYAELIRELNIFKNIADVNEKNRDIVGIWLENNKRFPCSSKKNREEFHVYVCITGWLKQNNKNTKWVSDKLAELGIKYKSKYRTRDKTIKDLFVRIDSFREKEGRNPKRNKKCPKEYRLACLAQSAYQRARKEGNKEVIEMFESRGIYGREKREEIRFRELLDDYKQCIANGETIKAGHRLNGKLKSIRDHYNERGYKEHIKSIFNEYGMIVDGKFVF